uniref:NAD(P)(+)--arginine ADP-ribosyltransferase n=1 Tax=Haptolina brevifila TaxID=156173 RepID=A0A7S2IMZ8_9EUKA|mmetsp:Transcript_68743/g.136204  ORF Transcript_68743/g.136204 Transcript_68743/m.136204 type:complete len:385 (+) Transcript_68743:1382-2536(+)
MVANLQYGGKLAPGCEERGAEMLRDLLEPLLSRDHTFYNKPANYEQVLAEINRAREQVLTKYEAPFHFEIWADGLRVRLSKLVAAFLREEWEAQVEVERFSSLRLKTGRPMDAALGFTKYLNVADERTIWQGMGQGVAAIVAEFEAHGNQDERECLEYVLHAQAGSSTKEWPHAGSRRMDVFEPGVPDDGRAGQPLAFFVDSLQARRSGLLVEHVIALRLYTTAAFSAINDPLRGFGRRATEAGKPHPFPITVAYLADGIRRLRAVAATAADANEAKDFWRGARNVELPDDFRSMGGTEFAPMSTSSNVRVALDYSDKAEKRLLMKVATSSFMERGADLRFLSAFPREVEFLYPPLTYLEFTGREERIVEGEVEYTVVEVKPHI